MTPAAKTFTDAFTQASRRNQPFDAGHKAQIDALETIAQQITEAGEFTASITTIGPLPVLDIKRNADGEGQSFFIEFGYDAFGGAPTTKLTTSLARVPLGGKEEGYSLQYQNDRDAALKEIGKEVARKIGVRKLAKETVAYAGGKKATP